VSRAIASGTDILFPALEKLCVYPIRVAFLPGAYDAGNKTLVTEITARPTSSATRCSHAQTEQQDILMNKHFYRPSEGHRLPHDPFKAIVAPRPIGWIGTCSASGINNLAPYSFFNAFSSAPPIIGFGSVGRKHSLENAESTGEFTWNLASYALAEHMNASCEGVAADVDEFSIAGLQPRAGQVVSAPCVEESMVSFECRTTQCIQLLDASGVNCDNWLLLGEVVGVHIDQRMLDEGIYQTARAEPIMRAGGPADYFVIREEALFRMHRPRNGGY